MSELLGWSLRFVRLTAAIRLIFAESAWAQEQDGKVLVSASLISDVDSFQPGQNVRIGVLYRIEPQFAVADPEGARRFRSVRLWSRALFLPSRRGRCSRINDSRLVPRLRLGQEALRAVAKRQHLAAKNAPRV